MVLSIKFSNIVQFWRKETLIIMVLHRTCNSNISKLIEDEITRKSSSIEQNYDVSDESR